MIIVVGHLTINPDKRAEAEAAIAKLVPLTEAEDGCGMYRYAADLQVPDRVNIVEQWESEDAMNAHMGSAHFMEFMGAIGDCIGGDVSVTRHDVASSTKLF